MTIMNMACAYQVGLNDFKKVEEMFRLALDWREKPLGKDHRDTIMCARDLAILFFQGAPSEGEIKAANHEVPSSPPGPGGWRAL